MQLACSYTWKHLLDVTFIKNKLQKESNWVNEISEILNEEDKTDESRCLEYMTTENELHDVD
jgi:hypothetical protein